ncbi:outer membrane autotransporter barrel domain-containing protein [Dyella jiangningensis]|uniref:Ig-like domain-containing protein n=2 Tax=Gammaproteobacteria TaxID=1236 RepID=UPI000881532B|nr:Ig-like domain-containing protein [Dyella sp. AtDHG13]PXV54077.1 outer membrane autotransporter protein [Dyella sp. AtDHG13]SDL08906.1 outer membrane autotransporter barrel domain-containing protein [Dyella jiangningensis]
MNAMCNTWTGRVWRGLGWLALLGASGLPGFAQASPGCQALNGQSGTIPAHGYVQLLTNSQQVNQGDAVTLTTPGLMSYGGSFLQMLVNNGSVNGVESGSGAGADNLSNLGNTATTYTVTCTSAGASITGVSPSSATIGSTVTLSGSGLWGTTQVLFGSLPATSFSVDYGGGGAIINAVVPNGSGTVTITLVTDAGTFIGGSFSFAPPTAGATSTSVAYNSSNNAVPLNLAGNPTSVAIVSAAAHGTAIAAGMGITYSPAAGYIGTDSFTYVASNAAGTSAPATATITVNPPPVPTVAAASATTAYNTATSINLASAISGVNITGVNIAQAPAHGTAIVTGETVAYTPSATFYGGTDTFTYTATNPGGTSSPATVTVTVGAVPAPTAGATSATTAYNTATNINLASVIAGTDITSVSIATAPAHGTVSVSGETVVYTPSATFYGGSDSFTYTATNPGGTSAPATVTVNVNTVGTPTVSASTLSTPYNTAATLHLASLISGINITGITIATAPAHGTVSVSGETVIYTPSSTFYGGSDSFTYTATNPGGTSAPATITITVGEVPVPTVAATSATTPFNTATTLDLARAINGTNITGISIATAPAHGTVSVSGETVTYTPSATFYGGSDSFTYMATNPGGTSAPATITVTVGEVPVPTVAATSATTPFNTATTLDLSHAITGTDVTGISIASAPAHGTVSVSGQTVTYTPSATFYGGSDSFSYTALNPGGHSAPATVTITVTPLATPTAVPLSVVTTKATPVLIEAAAQAGGTQPLTGASVSTQPLHGSATASGEQITYTPAAGFVGTDTFTYQLSNHFGASAPGTITVTVTAAGSTAGLSQTVTTRPGSPVSVNLAGIAPGTYASAALLGLSPAGAGSTTLNPPTTLTFTPTSAFHGLVQITAVLTPASGQPQVVDVLVLVSSQPDPSKNPDALGLINAQTMQAERFAQNQLRNIQSRLDSLHDGNATASFSNNLSISLDGKPLQATGASSANHVPGTPLLAGTRAGIGAAEDGDGTTPTDTPSPAKRAATPTPASSGLGVWIDGTADFGSFDTYRQSSGFDSDAVAVNTGVDQRLGEHAVVGLSLGYNHDRSDIGNDGTRSTAQGYSAAVYGSYQPAAHVYIDGVLGGGGLRFDSRRHAADSGAEVAGQRTGSQWFASLTAGYEFKSDGWSLSPYGRLAWSLSSLNGYAESGDAAEALSYGTQLVRTSQIIAGLRVNGQMAWGDNLFIPHARVEVGHDFQGSGDATLSYAYVPSAGSWNALTNPYAANGTTVQAAFGGDLQLWNNLLITTEYQYLLMPHAHDQGIRIGLHKQF